MKKLLFWLLLLLLLTSCNNTENNLIEDYSFYKGYDITNKDNLVELKYGDDYYIKISNKVFISLGNKTYEDNLEINDKIIKVDNKVIYFNKDKTMFELLIDNELLIFTKTNNVETFEEDFFKYTTDGFSSLTNFKLTFDKIGGFDLQYNKNSKLAIEDGKYSKYINYYVLNSGSKSYLIDNEYNFFFDSMTIKLKKENSEENIVKVTNYNYRNDISLSSEFNSAISNIFTDNKYILTDEVISSGTRTTFYNYSDYSCYISRFSSKFLVYEGEYLEDKGDGTFEGSFSLNISSLQFFEALNSNYEIYKESNTKYYLKINYSVIQDSMLMDSNFFEFAYYDNNLNEYYFEVILDNENININIYNNQNKHVYKQEYVYNGLEDQVDLSVAKQTRAFNLLDAVIPINFDKEYFIENSRFKTQNNYFKIDFVIGYYTIDISKLEKIDFYDKEGQKYSIFDIFEDVKFYNEGAEKFSFFVNSDKTYYIKIDTTPYGTASFYDYIFKVSKYDNLNNEEVLFAWYDNKDINVDNIYIAKEVKLNFNENKIINVKAESLEPLYIEIQNTEGFITGTYINKSFNHSFKIFKGETYKIVLRRDALLTITDGVDDLYQTTKETPFDLSNYNGENFITGTAFRTDFFIFNTNEKSYKFRTSLYMILEITDSMGSIIKPQNSINYIDNYVLESNNTYYITALSKQLYINYNFELIEILTGDINVTKLPFKEEVNFSSTTTIEFELTNKSLIYLSSDFSFEELLFKGEVIFTDISEVALVLDKGHYTIKSKHQNYDSNIVIEVIESNSDKISFNQGVELINSLSTVYNFQHEKEIFRIITNKNMTLRVNLEGNANYYIKNDKYISEEPQAHGYRVYMYDSNIDFIEIYAMGIGQRTIKLNYY